ncbi:MAG: VPLPA-CTERM sorting domain-containing protein [Pseudomonadota bacterium]
MAVARTIRAVAAAAMLTVTAVPSAHAIVLVDIFEQGSNVIATYRGSIDVTGLAAPIATTDSQNFIKPDVGHLASIAGAADAYRGTFSTPSFGAGAISNSLLRAGDSFAVIDDQIFLPSGYSGGEIEGNIIFLNQTLFTLGLDEGVFDTILPNDLVSIRIGEFAISGIVPLPASVLMLLGALGMAGLVGGRRAAA